MTQEPEPTDSTRLLNELRRTARKIFDRGADEEIGLHMAITFDQLDGRIEERHELPSQWRRHRGRPRNPEPGELMEGVVHGTRTGYNSGCGCLDCRAANREYIAGWRKSAKEQA